MIGNLGDDSADVGCEEHLNSAGVYAQRFELVVNHWKGYELDRCKFDSQNQAEDYFSAEYSDSDVVSDHSITLLGEDGNRSIFDDVDL